jgi:tetratricopeptide (TPR) repeat protein
MAELGELDASAELVHRALTTFHERGDRWGHAAALTTTAKLAHVRGDLDALDRDARLSAQIFGELGDHWGILQATHWLIGAAEMTGDYERAIRLSQDGLRMAEELGLWPEAAGQLAWLGWLSVELGDYVNARECCEQALRLATEQGFKAAVTTAKIGLAFAAHRDGKLDLAEEALRDLVALARRHGSDSGEALFLSMALIELGLLVGARGDVATALGLHLEGFDIARQQAAPRDTAWALDGIAAALAVDGRHLHAARLLGAAAAIRGSMGLPPGPGDQDIINQITGTVHAALGERAFAEAFEAGGKLTPEQARAIVDDVATLPSTRGR